jgi:hypothetical protein
MPTNGRRRNGSRAKRQYSLSLTRPLNLRKITATPFGLRSTSGGATRAPRSDNLTGRCGRRKGGLALTIPTWLPSYTRCGSRCLDPRGWGLLAFHQYPVEATVVSGDFGEANRIQDSFLLVIAPTVDGAIGPHPAGVVILGADRCELDCRCPVTTVAVPSARLHHGLRLRGGSRRPGAGWSPPPQAASGAAGAERRSESQGSNRRVLDAPNDRAQCPGGAENSTHLRLPPCGVGGPAGIPHGARA